MYVDVENKNINESFIMEALRIVCKCLKSLTLTFWRRAYSISQYNYFSVPTLIGGNCFLVNRT